MLMLNCLLALVFSVVVRNCGCFGCVNESLYFFLVIVLMSFLLLLLLLLCPCSGLCCKCFDVVIAVIVVAIDESLFWFMLQL